MNGVRRLLGTTGPSPPSQQDPLPTQPLSFASKFSNGPSWPPDAAPVQPATVSRQSTGSKSQYQPPKPSSASPTTSYTMPNSSASTSSSPKVSRFATRKSINPSDPNQWKRHSGQLNTRDELLMSLMASEAVIDCRDFDILSAEEIEELKKEHQVLNSRLGAMTKKLALETKIRDAAISLSRVKASQKAASKQSSEQLDAANARVETAQKELWKVSERYNEINRKLMEHRAGVLSFSVRSMEKKMSPGASEDSGYDSSNRSTLMSPTTSSMTGVSSSSKARFDGAHLFAGHAEAIVPKRKLTAEASAAEIASLEEKLNKATESLADASKKQAEMTRELSLMMLEKQEVETTLGLDLQAAESTIAALQEELPHLDELDLEVRQLREEKQSWDSDRINMQARLVDLEGKLTQSSGGAEKLLADTQESTKRQLEDKDAEIRTLRETLEDERAAWRRERTELEDEKLEDLAHMQHEMERAQDDSDQMLQQVNDELNIGLTTMESLIKRHGIVLFARDSSLQGLLNAIGTHIETIHNKLEAYAKMEVEWESARRRLEDDVRSGLDKREALTRELEDVRKERDSRTKVPSHLRTPSIPHSVLQPEESGELIGDMSRVIAILQPLWVILPSPEARAAKFGNNSRFRTGSPTPLTPTNASNSAATSLSDLDVRSLKTLYDGRQPTTPGSPKPNSGPFTVEAFAARVQALINDDKALIERLIRFAQAHDLLKKNAERAQKLAQDGNNALETYQKQVRILEERNMTMTTRQAALQEEVQTLNETIERLTGDLQDMEMRASAQAEQCEELEKVNNAMSAKTLSMADEAARASETLRKQLDDCKRQLEAAQDEIDGMRSSEQSQRIALLDELNSMQTENGSLRAQLRALKK